MTSRCLLAMCGAVCLWLAGPATAALSPLDSFNYVVGTQTIGAAYQFTPEPRLVETARAILALGSNVLKFSLTPQDQTAPQPATLAETAQRDPAVRTVLDLPFAHYVMWVSPRGAPPGGPFAPARLNAERQEVHDLARYLLTTYSGSGKSFYLGNWEGDWLLTHTNPDYLPTAAEVEQMVAWAQVRQQAVDDARRETLHANVQVYYYVEVNRVRDAMDGKVRVANRVLPAVNPDFVSYSSYDAQHGDVEANYTTALDYLQARLAPKPAIVGKRVFIGEYGLPQLGHGAKAQTSLVRHVLRAGLAWGCPLVLYWELYNNEVTPDGRQRGFWLIDDHGVKQPTWYAHQRFLQQAREYVAQYLAQHGQVPDRETFGRAALAWLPPEAPPPPSGPLAQGQPFVDRLHDLSQVASRTGDLVLDSSNPDCFEGRPFRLKRGGSDTAQSVVYRGNGIRRFALTGYVFGGFESPRGPKLLVATSADGEVWHTAAVTRQEAPTRSGWVRVVLTAARDLDEPAAWLRIELNHDAAIYSPQLGEVQLTTVGAPVAPPSLRLPSVLASGMVLQQGRPLHFWGADTPGRQVHVALQRVDERQALREGTATTDAAGEWSLELPGLPASCDELRATLSDGTTTRVLEQILIGEVWVCGGQSNMHLPVQYILGGEQRVARASNPFVRYFVQDQLPHRGLSGGVWSQQPQRDVAGGAWLTGDSPEALAQHEVSGIGYCFAEALFASFVARGRQVPVAIVNTATGATSIQAWLPSEPLRRDPLLATRLPRQWEGGEAAQAFNQATLEFNYKVAPLTGLGVRGFLWSQGENDVGGPEAWAYYRAALQTLIPAWRQAFRAPDAPFIAAQLHPHRYYDDLTTAAGLREAQIEACQAVPAAVALPIHDVPLTWNVGPFAYKSPVHPLDKAPVGQRMALAARALAYGEAVEYLGPQFERLEVQGDVARLSFSHTTGGLRAAGGVQGFALCGPDRVFHAAQATIAGSQVLLRAPDVTQPVAVTYGFTSQNQGANLANGAGLPANPFRSDKVASRYWHPPVVPDGP